MLLKAAFPWLTETRGLYNSPAMDVDDGADRPSDPRHQEGVTQFFR